jgi:hypothetical protein
MFRPIILAVYYDGEMGILTFENEQGALDHMSREVAAYYADEANSPPLYQTQEQVWDEINREAIPLTFKILDQRVNDRSLY